MGRKFSKGEGTTNNSNCFSDSHAYETPTPGKTSRIIGVVLCEAFCNSVARSAPPSPGMSLATKAKSGWSTAARRIASSGVDLTTPSQPRSFKLVIRNFAIVGSDSGIRTLGLLRSRLYPNPRFRHRAGCGASVNSQTKAKILKFLKDSFAYLLKATDTLDEKNLMTPAKHPWSGIQIPRLMFVTTGISHPWEMYGQMVIYLRMNGIDPHGNR
jgi:hypothetical protein